MGTSYLDCQGPQTVQEVVGCSGHQFDGFRVRLQVALRRRPEEYINTGTLSQDTPPTGQDTPPTGQDTPCVLERRIHTFRAQEPEVQVVQEVLLGAVQPDGRLPAEDFLDQQRHPSVRDGHKVRHAAPAPPAGTQIPQVDPEASQEDLSRRQERTRQVTFTSLLLTDSTRRIRSPHLLQVHVGVSDLLDVVWRQRGVPQQEVRQALLVPQESSNREKHHRDLHSSQPITCQYKPSMVPQVKQGPDQDQTRTRPGLDQD
ncbi:hypothetical protein EYF80_056800 [Liparis tanakae]|uniref:Uncharacterized protein n=1 Tax=Liparis tanakae TaxID=230148 RepID=A0A4Z2EVQ6_9TELE|nr:hypothetical protein EYF80_056800 [Liparis tanakae]